MAKVRSVFRCQECGGTAPKWAGRCPSCEAWNSLVEELDAAVLGVGRRPGRTDGSAGLHRRGRRRAVAAPSHRHPRARPGARRRPRPRVGHPARRRARASASRPCSLQAWPTVRADGSPRCSTSRPRSPPSRCGSGPSGSGRSAPRSASLPRRPCPTSLAFVEEVRPDAARGRLHPDRLRPRARLGGRVGHPGPGVRGARWWTRPRAAGWPWCSSATSPRTAAWPGRGSSSTSSTPC